MGMAQSRFRKFSWILFGGLALVLLLAWPAFSEGVQTGPQEVALSGISQAINMALAQAGIDGEIDVELLQELIDAGVPPGIIVSVAKYGIRAGLDIPELEKALTDLGEKVEDGEAPGRAANEVKAAIDRGEYSGDNGAGNGSGGTGSGEISSNGNGNSNGGVMAVVMDTVAMAKGKARGRERAKAKGNRE